MPFKVNQRHTIRRGRVFDITVENVTLTNGVTIDLEILRHPGAAAIVPLLADNRVVMLKQYRHAAGQFMWEIPAGTLNSDEAPLVCAQRELVEETGYRAAAWETMGAVTPVPGYSDEKIHLYLARDLTPAAQNLDPDEILEVHPLPLEEVVAMITDGRIHDAKTIAGIFLAMQRKDNRGQGNRF
jgi:ADP-ribose pyrophosphatase